MSWSFELELLSAFLLGEGEFLLYIFVSLVSLIAFSLLVNFQMLGRVRRVGVEWRVMDD